MHGLRNFCDNMRRNLLCGLVGADPLEVLVVAEPCRLALDEAARRGSHIQDQLLDAGGRGIGWIVVTRLHGDTLQKTSSEESS